MIPAAVSWISVTLMKPISGPIDRSTVARPASAVAINAYVESIRGATTISALPIPELDIRFGLLRTATISRPKNSRIGTSRNVLNEPPLDSARASLMACDCYSPSVRRSASSSFPRTPALPSFRRAPRRRLLPALPIFDACRGSPIPVVFDKAVQHRHQIFFEDLRVFAHREMADALHDDDFGIADLIGGLLGHFRRAGEIIDAGHHDDRHAPRNLAAEVAEIVVDAVEM